MTLLALTWKSLWNRRASLLLTVVSIAISVALLLGVEHIRKQAKASFMNTIAGTDLVVGARSGQIPLLLYSVFRMGNATNNIDWGSYQHFAQHAWVDWTIPLSLGDSHRGYRVLGTNQDYFEHYRYGNKQPLMLADGRVFSGVYDAVVGAEVARKLSYQVGSSIVLAHGSADTSFSRHDDKPFTVVGILKPTGTPIDRTVHVSLAGIEAIHIDWQEGAPTALKIDAEKAAKMHLQPEAITAFLAGLKNRAATFRLQREINDYAPEALLAVVPGIALAELWQVLGHFETVLRAITVLVVIAGLLGMLTTLLSTLNERRREMAILRAVGAHPWHIFVLFVLEAFVLVLLGMGLGIVLLSTVLLIAQPWVLAEYGFYLKLWLPTMSEGLLLAVMLGVAMLFSLLPGWVAYRRSLQDGLTVRV